MRRSRSNSAEVLLPYAAAIARDRVQLVITAYQDGLFDT
jgi:hypothetical protein